MSGSFENIAASLLLPGLYILLQLMSGLHFSDLLRIFATLDQDVNGRVSVDELGWLLDRLGAPAGPDELEEIVGGKDLDLEAFISFYESTLKRDDDDGDGNGDGDERDLLEAFKVFDLNNDGFISCAELKSVLSSLELCDMNSDCSRMIGEFDTNLDGRLDFEEFRKMMLLRVRLIQEPSSVEN